MPVALYATNQFWHHYPTYKTSRGQPFRVGLLSFAIVSIVRYVVQRLYLVVTLRVEDLLQLLG